MIFNGHGVHCKGSITISDSLIEIEDCHVKKKYQQDIRSYKYVLVSETIDSLSIKGAIIKSKILKSIDSEMPKEFTLSEGYPYPIYKNYIIYTERTLFKSASNDGKFDKVIDFIYLIKPV